MKKVVLSLAAGFVFAGATAMNVSAESYKVQKGDNLWNIADHYDTDVANLIDINDLNTDIIQPNQTLTVDEDQDKNEQKNYKVKKGDTLSGVAHKFDTSVSDLKDWNDLDSDIIVIGDKLMVKASQVNDDKKADEDVDNQPKEDNEPKEDKQEAKTEEPETKEVSNSEENDSSDEASQGKTVHVKATAYTAQCSGCSGVTATGVDLNKNPDKKVIAVDPSVIPLGSEVYVPGYGHAVAADTGGAIKGNRIDVHVPNDGEASSWGVKDLDVQVLN